MNFIDYYRDFYGVESICKLLPIAPSTFHRHKVLVKNDKLRCKRHHTDEKLKGKIQRVWQANHRVYGVSKVWKQLKREIIKTTVERLMRMHRTLQFTLIEILSPACNSQKMKYGIGQSTFYKWHSKYDGIEASDIKRLKELEEENRKLKVLQKNCKNK